MAKQATPREAAEELFDRAKSMIFSRMEELELSIYRVSKDTGISYSALNRFSRDGSIETKNLLLLLSYLGIWLTRIDEHEREAKSKPKRRKRTSA